MADRIEDDNVEPGGSGSKPRRLEDETVKYLTQLDVELSVEGLDSADKDVLVENVLTEIKQRTASAACDRRTNYIIEKLCYLSSLKNLVEIIKRISPYTVFLSRNRHASHVLQAVLARLCFILKNEGIGDMEEETLKQTVLDFVGLMLAEISWLAKDLNASHVVRSAICALAGIPVVSERKGKGSKHQHSVSLSEPLDSLLSPGKFYVDKKVCFGVPDDFHETLGQSAASLLALPIRELQAMVADSSSCAVIGLLLRIFFSPDIIYSGAELAERIARAALEFPYGSSISQGDSVEKVHSSSSRGRSSSSERNNDPRRPQTTTTSVFYAMAGDRSGSYFLETIMECCAVDFFIELVKYYLHGAVMEYATDSGGNFVLQAALRRLSAELERRQASQEKLGELEDCASVLLKELMADPTAFAALALNKGGVVLWMLEVARWISKPVDTPHNRSGSSSSRIQFTSTTASSTSSTTGVNWSEVVGNELVNVWTENGAKTLNSVLAAKFTPRDVPSSSAKSGDNGSKKAEFHGNTKGGGADAAVVPAERDTAQLLIARLTGSLLRVSGSSFVEGDRGGILKDTKIDKVEEDDGLPPDETETKKKKKKTKIEENESNHTENSLQKEKATLSVSALVAKAIASLPSNVLKHLTTSGPLSRAVVDTFLEYSTGNTFSSTFATAPGSKASFPSADDGSNGFSELSSSMKSPSAGKVLSQREVEHRARDRSKFLQNLQPLVVELASHFSGQHVLRRAYDCATATEKEKIVTALDAAKDTISRTKEGRNTLRNVQAELYSRKPDEWRALLRKQSKALEMLAELEVGGDRHRGAPSSASFAEGKKTWKDNNEVNTAQNTRGIQNSRPSSFPGNDGRGGWKAGANDSGDGGSRRAVEIDDGDGDEGGEEYKDEENKGGGGEGKRKRKRKRSGKTKNSEDHTAILGNNATNAGRPSVGLMAAPARSLPPTDSARPLASLLVSSDSKKADMKLIEKLRNGKISNMKLLGAELDKHKRDG